MNTENDSVKPCTLWKSTKWLIENFKTTPIKELWIQRLSLRTPLDVAFATLDVLYQEFHDYFFMKVEGNIKDKLWIHFEPRSKELNDKVSFTSLNFVKGKLNNNYYNEQSLERINRLIDLYHDRRNACHH